MSVVWDRDHTSAGFSFSFGGWVYQLHHDYFVASPGRVLCFGRYK